jgi:hypothetical protein
MKKKFPFQKKSLKKKKQNKYSYTLACFTKLFQRYNTNTIQYHTTCGILLFIWYYLLMFINLLTDL